MSARTVSLAGQRAAFRELMTDECRIERKDQSNPNPPDPVTGKVTFPTLVLYEGPCRVRPNGAGRELEVGQLDVGQFNMLVFVPLSVQGLRFNDLVTITGSADADLVGVTMRFRNVLKGTHITARRLVCEEESS